MKYCKNYCEEKGISTSTLNEAQRTLYYIAENMKMNKSINEEGYKHFQIAIQALEQEPCEDAISRTKAIKTIQRYGVGALDFEDYTPEQAERFVINQLNELPSVLPQQKVGHWIYDKAIENWRCSECNETPRTMGYVGTSDFMAEHFRFCNHCGIKMKVSENEW